MKQAYEVVIRDDNGSISCGDMYVTYIKQYLHNLSKNNFIPADSCVYDINARFFQYDESKVHLQRRYIQNRLSEDSAACLQIHVRNTIRQKCPESCLRNIQDGKCTDKFMINNVGKIFFPDKYNNTKQR